MIRRQSVLLGNQKERCWGVPLPRRCRDAPIGRCLVHARARLRMRSVRYASCSGPLLGGRATSTSPGYLPASLPTLTPSLSCPPPGLPFSVSPLEGQSESAGARRHLSVWGWFTTSDSDAAAALEQVRRTAARHTRTPRTHQAFGLVTLVDCRVVVSCGQLFFLSWIPGQIWVTGQIVCQWSNIGHGSALARAARTAPGPLRISVITVRDHQRPMAWVLWAPVTSLFSYARCHFLFLRFLHAPQDGAVLGQQRVLRGSASLNSSFPFLKPFFPVNPADFQNLAAIQAGPPAVLGCQAEPAALRRDFSPGQKNGVS